MEKLIDNVYEKSSPEASRIAEKNRRIKTEIAKLKSIFKAIEKDKIKLVEKLINNAAFMAVTLELLQEDININGCISDYQNGANQWGTKKSPEIEIYNTMIKN